MEVVEAMDVIEAPPRAPKLCGADVELGNFIEGLVRAGGTGSDAARALLEEVDGVPGQRARLLPTCPCEDCASRRRSTWWPQAPVYDPQDWGRKFLATNGGCVYIDLAHLEICLPEVRSARDWVAAWYAMLGVARRALRDASVKLPEGQRLHVIANNSDGRGNSYGSHLDMLVTSRAMENLFQRKCQYMLWLASYQISSILFTGQGKVGAENGAEPVDYQIAQRADFFQQLCAVPTTFDRPIVNAREEALCGSSWSPTARKYGRLHVIFYDSTLSQVSCFLKVGVLQIVLAMIEAEEIDPGLILDDPLSALRDWSHDPALVRTAARLDGAHVTAVEHQMLFLEAARRFVAAGRCEGIVPGAEEIVARWGETLELLAARDFDRLAGRLDWVLKKAVLERLLDRRPELDWSSPELKHLDLLFASLDPDTGLFWAYDSLTERIVSDESIARFQREPPDDTRAWTRAMLLRSVPAHRIDEIDWDLVKLRVGEDTWAEHRRVELDDPLGFTRADMQHAFDASTDGESAIDGLIDALDPVTSGEPSPERSTTDG